MHTLLAAKGRVPQVRHRALVGEVELAELVLDRPDHTFIKVIKAIKAMHAIKVYHGGNS